MWLPVNSVDDRLIGLAQSAVLIFIGTVIARLLGLASEILIVRSLVPDVYGHLALAFTVITVVGQLSLLGIPDGVARMMSTPEDRSNRWDVLRGAYAIATISIVIAILFVYFARGFIATLLSDKTLSNYLVLLLPYLVFYPLAMVSFGAIRANKRSVDALISRYIAPRSIALLLLIVGIYVFNEPIAGALVYWTLFPGLILAFSVMMIYRFSEDKLLRLPKRGRTADLWRFSWPLAIGSLIFMFLSQIDILMVGYFMESRYVGYYRAIQPLKQVTIFVTVAFTFLFLPLATEYFEKNDIPGLGELYTVSTKWITLLTLPLALLLVLFPVEIIRILYTDAYLPASTALSILIAGLFVRVLVGLNGDLVKAVNLPKVEMYSGFLGVIVNILSNYYLIPMFGIAGAAIGTALGYIVYNGVEVFIIYWFVGIHPFSLNILKPLISTSGFALLIRYYTVGWEIGLIGFVIIGLLLSSITVFSLLVTRSIDAADISLVEEFERKIGKDLTKAKNLLMRFS